MSDQTLRFEWAGAREVENLLLSREGRTVLGMINRIVNTDHNSIARRFTKEDLAFLTAIADRVAIPLKNSKLLRDREEELTETRGQLEESLKKLETKYRYDKLIGRTEPMQKVFHLLDRIVDTHHSVVIHA